MSAGRPRIRGIHIPILLACLAVSFICVAYPYYVIRPFRAQGAREFAIALALARFQPLITLISAGVAVLAVAGYWRQKPRIWRRLLATVGAGLVAVLALVARVNIFERMFHPIERSTFTVATDVKLDADEKVIAVVVGGEARAYPVRSLAYHHVINDTVGGKAIVGTY